MSASMSDDRLGSGRLGNSLRVKAVCCGNVNSAATEEKVELFGDPGWTTLGPLSLDRVCRGKSAIPECVRSPWKAEWV